MGSTREQYYDAFVVGTGFAGLYALYLLKQQGLNVHCVESGADVGGTWFWNTYPGARSDVESHVYCYSWDKDLLKSFPWPHNYLMQSELANYFQEVARKHELYPLIQFNTELREAAWDDEANLWRIKVSTGEQFTTRYLVTAVGILHQPHVPDIPGLETFNGKAVHSSKWYPELQYEDKNVAVIGTGASGVQIVGALIEKAKETTHFFRHAQYVLPASYREVLSEERARVNDGYDKIWDEVFESAVGFGFPEPARATFSVTPEEREKIFQDLWDKGSGFRFMFGGFNDLIINEDANKEAISFIHRKIKEIVKDPQKAEVLTSNDWFARRPLTDDRYYRNFNKENVHVHDLKKAPITAIVPEGIQTADGKVHPLDLIVFATGFDAVDGSYLRLDFKGRKGKTLAEHWKDGPSSHHGATTSDFPNLFFINGPGVPFANNPPTIELAAQYVTDIIKETEKYRRDGKGAGVVESTAEADAEWLAEMAKVGHMTLFAKTGSWFFGENTRKHAPRFWFGGIKTYRAAVQEVQDKGYPGFIFS